MKLDDVCRCCMSESTDLLNIHSSIECYNSDEVIYSMLTWTFNVEIPPNDDLPHLICSECLKTLKLAYCFKRTMENSKKILTIHLDSRGINDLSDDEPLSQMLKNKINDTTNENFDNEEYLDENIDYDMSEYNEEKPKCDKIIKERICYSFNAEVDKYFYCTICPNKFSNPTDMYEHYNEIHKSDELGRPCDFCNQRFPEFKPLIEHRKKHFHPYVCSVCWGGFHSKTEFSNHVEVCEPKKKDKDAPINVRKMTMCHVCGKSYPVTYISVHMKIHNEGSLPCKICGKKFKQPASLGSHVLWNHKKVKKHKCDFCDKLFVTSSARGSHIRETHMKEKNVPCDTCGKLFFSKGRMKKHNLTHTGEKNFSCAFCDKSYQTKYGLNVHLKSHTFVESVCN